MLEAGQKVPDLTLTDQDGQPFRISDLNGSWVVLWWFPKAATAG